MLFLLRLITRNLLRQKLRTALTVLGIVIAIAAFCLLHTVVSAWYGGVNASSASRLVTRHAVSLSFSLPVSYQAKIARISGVTQVASAAWFGGIYIDEKNFFPQFAVPPREYLEVIPEFICSPEEKTAFIRDRKGAMVGRKLADRYGWKLGDVVPLRGTIYPGQWSFVVRCIYRGAEKSTDETQFFFHWDNLNENLKQRDDERANHVGIFLTHIDDPGRAAEISEEIDGTFRNSLAETLTETEKAFQLSFVAMTETIVVAIQIVSWVVIVIIMAVMANTMAMSARERGREYATLKALGFGPPFVVALIGGESVFISLLGGLAGVALSHPVVGFLAVKFGALFPVFIMSDRTVVLALLAALAVGAIAAVLPAWKAVTLPVGEGLRSIG
jgi:putative ABC transport system permease protein